MLCSHGQGGKTVEPVWTFWRQRGNGVSFSRICADINYGRPLNNINKVWLETHGKFALHFFCLLPAKLLMQSINTWDK